MMDFVQEYLPAYIARLQYSFTMIFTMTIGLYLLVYVLFKKKVFNRRIQWQVDAQREIIRHDIKWTIINVLFVSVIPIAVLFLVNQKIVMPLEDGPVSAWIIVVQFVVFFFLFDAIYYPLHRLLHREPFYSLIHCYHHQANRPTFFTSYAFSPIEGLLMASMSWIAAYGLGFHLYSLIAIQLFQFLMNLSVHSGHEYFPRWWYEKWYSRWFISPIFHDQHHKAYTANYGAFTTIWDRVYKSVYPNLRLEYELLQRRIHGEENLADKLDAA